MGQTTEIRLIHDSLIVNDYLAATTVRVENNHLTLVTSRYGHARHAKRRLHEPIIHKIPLEHPDMLQLAVDYLIANIGTPE